VFPIGDSPNPRGTAFVNLALIAINVAVFVLLLPQTRRQADPHDPRLAEYVEVVQRELKLSPADTERARREVTEYDLTVFEHGSRPSKPSFLDMLTSMFLHGGFMHLAGNMLFLWIYGNNVEFRLGRIPYLLAYLVTGYAASFGDLLLRPGSDLPGVGASGAISGVLGLYFVWFPRNQVRLLIFFPPIVQAMDVGARWVLGFYIVVQNLLPVLISGGRGGGIAYGAHIGGFVGGVALALLERVAERAWPGRRQSEEERPRPGEVAEARAEGLLSSFRRALERGDVHRASRLFFEAPRELAREGLTPRDASRLGEALAYAGEPRGALAAYDRALALSDGGSDAAEAHLGAARALLDAGQPTLAYQHVHDALAAGVRGPMTDEARALLQQIRGEVRTVPRRFGG
jgi:membrane associated rhomboid family serine protease